MLALGAPVRSLPSESADAHAGAARVPGVVRALCSADGPVPTRDVPPDADAARRVLHELLACGWVERVASPTDPRAEAWRPTAWLAQLGSNWDRFLRLGDLDALARCRPGLDRELPAPTHAATRVVVRLVEVLHTSCLRLPTAEVALIAGIERNQARRVLRALDGASWATGVLGERRTDSETWTAGPGLAALTRAWIQLQTRELQRLQTLLHRVQHA